MAEPDQQRPTVWDLSPEDLEALAELDAALERDAAGTPADQVPHWVRRRRERYDSDARRAALRFGARGERLAARLLRELGMTVLYRHYLGPHGELDLIARDGEVICFVEVKTRRRSPRTRPGDAMTHQKKRAIAHTAARYLRDIGRPDIQYRFDVVEVVFSLDRRRLVDLRYWPAEFGSEDLRRLAERRRDRGR